MITLAQAEEIAAGWARLETARRGYECSAVVVEFDLGYAVWTRRADAATAEPGDGGRTVIDRDLGLVTTWPAVPVETLAELYRAQHPALSAQRRTVQPSVELLRGVRRKHSPTTAAHLTVDGHVFRARGAKGDQEIDHHPLIAGMFRAAAPHGELVRGCERHAELIVLSDALHEVERARSEPLTLETAREAMRDSIFEAFYVREPGDPLAGAPAAPCDTCATGLAGFGVKSWEEVPVWGPPWYDDQPAEPDRFPDEVARRLAGCGWKPLIGLIGREALADQKITMAQQHGHQTFPAARRLLVDFPVMVAKRRMPGVRHRVRLFQFDMRVALHTAGVLADFAEVIGVPLFPFGTEEDGDSILAVDERGRVFALDQGGEWLIGETTDEAMTDLVMGDGPAARVQDDGTW
ncbi:SUKH-3 domain-containing protein [Actinoplanes sp. NPDC051470]|uniref:SUKH-3 domain-containing protein n=1 Tax=unclassified Actinoplanes TaxID=2626549 RepID=UPI0034295F5E